MQRRHSSNTDGMPPERSRSQTVGSESSPDEGGGGGGAFDCLKAESPTSPQQIFSGLVGVPSGAVSSAQFQAATLVLGSHPDVFIQMTALSREEGGLRRPEGGAFLPRPPHLQHFRQPPPPLQHRTASLLQQAAVAAAAAGSERHHHGPRDEAAAAASQEEPSSPAPALSELKALVSWLQRGFPFILILLAKICFQHKLGIALAVGMASTFAYANTTFKHQVSLREERSMLVALWIAFFLSGNVAYVYYAFRQEELHNSLMFSRPNLNTFDFFDLMWAVGINDFVLKFVTIGLKSFVLFLPGLFVAFKSRLWYKYIMGEEPSASYFLGAALIIIYSLCKSFDICSRASALRKALLILCRSQKDNLPEHTEYQCEQHQYHTCHKQSYGTRAGGQQCSEAGDVCAICQAAFREPVLLSCRHVFCEECLSSWLDRERACPLCRANVVENLRCWKDGTTSAHFQIY